MRLLFSVAVLLITASVLIEASAAKSNRGTDTTEDSSKSIDSKDVRYSKTKSQFKTKGNGNKQEVVREKKQRYEVKENQKMKPNGFTKKNENKLNGKTSTGQQKRHKSDKLNKVIKKGNNLENDKIIKVAKDEAKRHKRSPELEQPEDLLVNDAVENSDSKLEISEKKSKNKFGAKSKKSNKKTAESKDILTSEEPVFHDQLAEETTSSLNNTVKSSSESKVTEELNINSKNRKHKNKREQVDGRYVNIKKNKWTKEIVETPQKFTESEEENKYFGELSDNIENLNENKLQRPCEEASNCECRVKDCATNNSKKSKSKISNFKGSCSSKNQIEKSKYVAGSQDKDNVAIENDEHSELIQNENEEQDDKSVEGEDCAGQNQCETI